MAFKTQLTNAPVIHGQASDITHLIYGTLEWNDDLGQIKSARVSRTGDLDVLASPAGNTRAALIANPRFEVDVSAVFHDAATDAFTLGDTVDLSLLGVSAMVIDMELAWEEKGYKMYSIRLTAWDSLQGVSVAPVTASSTATGGFSD